MNAAALYSFQVVPDSAHLDQLDASEEFYESIQFRDRPRIANPGRVLISFFPCPPVIRRPFIAEARERLKDLIQKNAGPHYTHQSCSNIRAGLEALLDYWSSIGALDYPEKAGFVGNELLVSIRR